MKEKIIELFHLTGFEDSFKQLKQEMLKIIQEQFKDDEESFEKIMYVVVKEFRSEKLLDKYIELYERHYTPEEVDYLYNFYSSDIGKSIALKNKDIGVEVFHFSNQLTEDIKNKIEEEFNI